MDRAWISDMLPVSGKLPFNSGWERMEDTTILCQLCGKEGTVIVRNNQRIVLCSNPSCPAFDPQRLSTLAAAAFNLRARTIGFGEFKRIVDSSIKIVDSSINQ